jgi:hypothetical protein
MTRSIASCTLLGASVFMFLFGTPAWTSNFDEAPAEAVGMIVGINGGEEVTVYNPKKKASRLAKVQAPLFEGEEILSGDAQTTVIELKNKSEIVVGPNTSFALEKSKADAGVVQTNIQLFYGLLRSVVRKKLNDNESYKINSGGVVMGIRGTDFVVEVGRKDMVITIHTLEGSVAATDPNNTLLVNAGNLARIVPRQPIPHETEEFNADEYKKTLKNMGKYLASANPIQEASEVWNGSGKLIKPSDSKPAIPNSQDSSSGGPTKALENVKPEASASPTPAPITGGVSETRFSGKPGQQDQSPKFNKSDAKPEAKATPAPVPAQTK